MKNKTLDSLTIQQYLEGKMDALKMHELEKQSLEDQFLSDALEGYSYVAEPAEKLSILQQRLANRVQEQTASKQAFGISAQRLSIAAASGLMFILAAILFWMNGYKSPDTKQVQVKLTTEKVNENHLHVNEPKPASVISPVVEIAKRSTSLSEPMSGWSEYTRYIEKNLPAPNNALKNHAETLIIAFKISRSGNPVDLRLMNGQPDGFTDKVMHLIKNGPLWKPVDSEEVTLRVNVKK